MPGMQPTTIGGGPPRIPPPPAAAGAPGPAPAPGRQTSSVAVGPRPVSIADVQAYYKRRNAGPAAAAGPDRGGATTNTAQTNPHLDELWERYKGRLSTDTSGRAIEQATGAIADSAALLGKDARANMASRGVLGSGVGAAYLQRHVTEPAQRAAAKAATDITLGETARQDALTLGGLGLAKAPAELALGQQGLALQQYQTDAQLQMAQNQQQVQQMIALANMVSGL